MRGIKIILHAKTQTGTDSFNAPVYEDTDIEVDNVLVGEPSSDDIIQELNLHGKHLAYVLAIPKGDTNNWFNNDVTFFGERFHVYAAPTQGIDTLVPTAWNKKVKVERYG